MLPKYTYAVGGTDKLKKFIDWLQEHKEITEDIRKKYENKEAFTI